MNKKFFDNRIIILALVIFLLCARLLFAAQSEIISLTVKLNRIPEILDVQPPDGSTSYPEDSIKISVNAQDVDNDTLLYQFSIDGAVIGPWQSSSGFSWSTNGVSFGMHTIKAEVKDANGAVVSQSVELYLFIKPPALPAL